MSVLARAERRLRTTGVTTLAVFSIALCAALLLPATVAVCTPVPTDVSASGASDMVYNDTTGILYIAAGDQVVRYDYLHGTYLSPFVVGGALRGIDLSPDGKTLAIADASTAAGALSWIHLVDTTTGQDTKVFFNLSLLGDQGTYSVAFSADDNVFVTSSMAPHAEGELSVHQYNLATKQIGTPLMLPEDSMLAPSADHRYVAFGAAKAEPAGWGLYDSNAHGWVASGLLGDAFPYDVSCNATGSLVVLPTYNGALVAGSGPPSPIGMPTSAVQGAAFHPNRGVLFLSMINSQSIVAYDVGTGAQLATYDAGEYMYWWGNFAAYTTGRLKVGAGGALLFCLHGGSGVRIIPTGIGPVPVGVEWTSPSSGTLRAADGSPVAGVQLAVSIRGGAVANQPYTTVTTGDDGAFSFSAPVLRDTRWAHVSYAGAADQYLSTTCDGPRFAVDQHAPATTAEAVPGWYARTDIDVSLDAADPPVFDGASSGVSATFASVDGAPSSLYVDPIHLSGTGAHTVSFASVDAAGNLEATRTVTAIIDPDAPRLSLRGTTATDSYSNAAVVSCVATDALSGVAACTYSVDGGADKSGFTATVTSPGQHDLLFTVTDRAGNEGTIEATLRVVSKTPKLVSASAPSRARPGVGIVVSAVVSPADIKGGAPVRFRFYQRVRGAWTLKSTKTGAGHMASSRTEYTASLSLGAGQWRMQAEYARGGRTQKSAWRSIAVR